MSEKPKIVSFGGGLNSTAMIIGMWQKGIKPDLILFADTGGEWPETYDHLIKFNDWLLARHWPEITVVKQASKDYGTLEQECAHSKNLPAIAYGFKSCSDKWKIRPQDRFLNRWPVARKEWKQGGKVLKYIGYDAGEERRKTGAEKSRSKWGKRYENIYPLIEWGWYREECEKVSKSEGFNPPKSSCFFCPNMRKWEILKLKKEHPDLLARAIAIENNSDAHTVKGLGRTWAWRDFVANEDAQCKLFPEEAKDQPCGCHDQAEE